MSSSNGRSDSWPPTSPKNCCAASSKPAMRFGQTTIRNKIIYGTGAFLINRPYTQLCDEMRALPLQREVLDDWLWRNADHLLQHDR
jgi:uncharacterized protein